MEIGVEEGLPLTAQLEEVEAELLEVWLVSSPQSAPYAQIM